MGEGVRGPNGARFRLRSKSWDVAHGVVTTGSCCGARLKGAKAWEVLVLNSTLKKKTTSVLKTRERKESNSGAFLVTEVSDGASGFHRSETVRMRPGPSREGRERATGKGCSNQFWGFAFALSVAFPVSEKSCGTHFPSHTLRTECVGSSRFIPAVEAKREGSGRKSGDPWEEVRWRHHHLRPYFHHRRKR